MNWVHGYPYIAVFCFQFIIQEGNLFLKNKHESWKIKLMRQKWLNIEEDRINRKIT